MEAQCLMFLLLGLLLPQAVYLCLPGEQMYLHASEEKQIISVSPQTLLTFITSGDIRCIWSIQSPSSHSSLVVQILDLDIEEDTDDYLEIRECDVDSCPETCGEEFDPEEDDVECHQWCEETGPEEEFESPDSCAHVELSLTARHSQRGLLLAFWSSANEVTVVGRANFTVVNYLLFGWIVLSLTGLVIALLIILNHRKWHCKICRRSNKARLIVVAPAPSIEQY